MVGRNPWLTGLFAGTAEISLLSQAAQKRRFS